MEGIYLDPKSQRHKEIAIGKVRDGLKKIEIHIVWRRSENSTSKVNDPKDWYN